MSQRKHLRVAAYNILAGGFKDYSYELPSPERLGLLQEAISSLDADVVGLVDTFRWEEIYPQEKLRQLFGYQYAKVINLEDERLVQKGHNNGVGLLSNITVKKSRILKIHNRNALLSTLNIHGSLVDVGVVYLDDLSEDVRLQQIQSLVSQLNSERPVILMGDFNTMDKRELKRSMSVVGKLKTGVKEHLWPKLLNMGQGLVVNYLRSQGFKDGATNPMPTAPTKLIRPATLKEPLVRLDYVWHRGSVGVGNVRVAREPIFDKASDHYPIVFDVSLPS